MHLRHATQAVSILNPRVMLPVCLSNFRLLHQPHQVRCCRNLPRMGPSRPEFAHRRLPACPSAPPATLPSQVRQPRHTASPGYREGSHSRHRLRAIQQRQPFLGTKCKRPQPCPPQGLGARHSLTLVNRLPFADEHQRQMQPAAPNLRWRPPTPFRGSPGSPLHSTAPPATPARPPCNH